MIPRELIPWFLFLLTVSVSACVGEGSSPSSDLNYSFYSEKADGDGVLDVCDSDDSDYDPDDPRCKVEIGPGGSGVKEPATCAGNEPMCNRAQQYPTQQELTITNSQNLVFNSVERSLTLAPSSGGIVDTDGDGVPDPADECAGVGFRAPCDGDASDDGLYQTVYYGSGGEYTLGADINVDGKISAADVYILMDATGSMVGEQKQLIADLINGTFIDPGECADASDTGLVGALSCVIEDVRMGLGQFNEVPLAPHGHPFRYTPYHHHLDITDNLQHLLDAVSALTTTFNKDHPESITQAIYSVTTGQGLGPWVPNRRGCPAGRWGYPCFRPTALPVIMLFTDAEMFNGPRAESPTYGDPPFDGTVGLATRLPPVEMDPAMIYSNDILTAHNLGDLSTKSVTVKGTNVNFGNDFTTWDHPSCQSCSAKNGCWGDGYDGVVRFSVDAGFEAAMGTAFVSGEGSFYPYARIALVDSGLNYLDCNIGPGGGDYWGRTTQALTAGTWYAVSDSGVSPSSSANSNIGPFQIRIQTTPDDSTWETRAMPIPWNDVETEVLAKAVKFVSIVSPGDNGFVAQPDADALGLLTGSVDQYGDPYTSTIAGDGTGLTTGILDAVRALVGDTRRDITVIAEDNPATPGVDESQFVETIVAARCPTTGINNCLGGAGTDTCRGCLADSDLSFEFRVGNDFVPPSAVDQVFEFDLVSLADGSVELTRIPVRVMVPALGGGYGAGFYQQTYDSDDVCIVPPERPDWGFLNWYGTTPSDSKIVFEFFTDDFRTELDNQIPVSITVPDDTAENWIDLGPYLVSNGLPNYLLHTRIRARLEPSSDGLSTPTLSGWSLEFDCVPLE